MTYGYDVAVATSTGTGTSQTQINSGNTLFSPNTAQVVNELVPWQTPSGAMTAAQSSLQMLEIQSRSVFVMPKRIMIPPVMGGLGTFPFAMEPALASIPAGTVIPGIIDLLLFGTAQVANTAGFLVGCTVGYSDAAPTFFEQFYEFAGGVTAASNNTTRTAGTAFTVNNAVMITSAYCINAINGVLAASVSYGGVADFQSPDFLSALPIKFPVNPVISALGTLIGAAIPVQKYWNVQMPIQPSSRITPGYTADVAPGAATESFVSGIGFVRRLS